MKKVGIILVIIFAFFLVIVPKQDDEIRVRVIGNSNNQVDVDIKLKVRDKLLELIDPLVAKDKEKTERNIQENITVIEEKLKEIVPCSVTFNIESFPIKAKNGELIDGKKVKTLLVLIEDGKGENWWSTLYPAQSNITENVEYRSLIKDKIDEIWG